MGLGDGPGDCLPGEGPLRDKGQLGSVGTLVFSGGAVGLSRREHRSVSQEDRVNGVKGKSLKRFSDPQSLFPFS